MSNISESLQKLSIKTMIGQIPGIINGNNDIIINLFQKFYNFDKGILIKSLDTTLDNTNENQNYVKTHTGTFLNILTDNLVANKISTKELIIDGDTNNGFNHNVLNGNYLYRDLASGKISKVPVSNMPLNLNKFCHNAGATGVYFGDSENNILLSLQEVLEILINGSITIVQNNETKTITLSDLQSYTHIDSRTYNDDTTVEREASVSLYGSKDDILSEPNSFTFDNNLLFATNVQLKRLNLPTYQLNDIKSGNLYTYYDYAKVITITDENIVSLNGKKGQVIKLNFNDLKKKAYYRVILSRKDKKILRISKDELLRLNLICLSYDDTYGAIWDVDNYSVRHPDDLIIERK